MKTLDLKPSFRDNVKEKEYIYTQKSVEKDKPFCVRLDGKAFHTFTKGLKRPFDKRLSDIMIQTMNYLVKQTGAKLGYTQSDEISLIFYNNNNKKNQDIYLGGKLQKLISIISSIATAKFNQLIGDNIPERKNTLAFFDARVWSIENLNDAAEVIVWRQEDAIKNAISMAAHSFFSHKELNKKNSDEKIKMLSNVGCNFEDYPEFFKSGTFAMIKITEIKIDLDEDNAKHQNKEFTARKLIHNFHIDRIKFQSNWEKIIFEPVNQEYKKFAD